MDDGWIKLHRKSLKSSIFTNPKYWYVWCWILMKASHGGKIIPFNGEDITLLPGAFITGRKSALEELSTISEQSYKSSLSYLKSTNRITIQSTNRFSIIQVQNWEKYQGSNQPTNQPSKQLATSQQPTSNHKQECKELKNDKNIYTPLMETFNKRFGSNYQLTDGRIQKIRTRLKTYTMEQLEEAIITMSQIPFYRGENKNKWKANPDYLFRSDEQIDRFINSKPVVGQSLSEMIEEVIGNA